MNSNWSLSLLAFLRDWLFALRWIQPMRPLWVIGNALRKGKIGIIADREIFDSLENLLKNSRLFAGENIQRITSMDIKGSGAYSLWIVHWASAKEHEETLRQVLDSEGRFSSLIIYAPAGEGDIPEDMMKDIGKRVDVIVVRMRGRLLNDVFCRMITHQKETK